MDNGVLVDQLTNLRRALVSSADEAAVAEDFLRNLLGSSGPDVVMRAAQLRAGFLRSWLGRERIASTVVGGDQLRRARLALADHCAGIDRLRALSYPEEVAALWRTLRAALDDNAVDLAEFTEAQFDVPNAARAARVGDVLRRVRAAAAAIERARLGLVLATSRALA